MMIGDDGHARLRVEGPEALGEFQVAVHENELVEAIT